jgi:hypothetical protein
MHAIDNENIENMADPNATINSTPRMAPGSHRIDTCNANAMP